MFQNVASTDFFLERSGTLDRRIKAEDRDTSLLDFTNGNSIVASFSLSVKYLVLTDKMKQEVVQKQKRIYSSAPNLQFAQGNIT